MILLGDSTDASPSILPTNDEVMCKLQGVELTPVATEVDELQEQGGGTLGGGACGEKVVRGLH